MRNRMSPYWTGIVALVLLPSLSAGQARGQRGGRGAASPAPSAPAPHWADGRVNLDAAPGQKGFWNVMQGNVVGRRGSSLPTNPTLDEVPFQDWARALYGNPFLVILDEPNSNLDNEGAVALRQAIVDLRARGSIVILIAHRPSLLETCDKLLLLGHDGLPALGPRDDILRKVMPRSAFAPPAYSLKVVSDTTDGGRK